MSSIELKYKNGLIGLAFENNGTWPSPLAGRGYVVTALENPITTELDGHPETVTPEFILSSADQQHIALWEAKHASFKIPQARKLRAITTSELVVQGASVPGVRRDAKKDVIYVCPHEHAETLHGRLQAAGFHFPELSISGESISLFAGTFVDEHFAKVFGQGISFRGLEWPSHFVPFDYDSGEEEIAPHALGALVNILLGQQTCESEDVCRLADPLWDVRGRPNASLLKKRIEAVLTEAVNEELAAFVTRPTTQPVFRRISSKGWNAQTLDTISDHVLSFNQRKQLGIGYKAGQLRLFAYDWGLPGQN